LPDVHILENGARGCMPCGTTITQPASGHPQAHLERMTVMPGVTVQPTLRLQSPSALPWSILDDNFTMLANAINPFTQPTGANGQVLTLAGGAPAWQTPSVPAATAIPYTASFSGAATRTVQAKLLENVALTDFIGADSSGATSSWQALSDGVTFCKMLGAELNVPPGNYLIDTDRGSITLEYVTIAGSCSINGTASPTSSGSVFSFTGTTNSPFLMRRGVTFDGIAFYYPNQVDSATPTVYPPTIQVDTSDGAVNFCYIRDCVVFNAYRFLVDTDATGGIGHIFIENNTIYGILTCFEFAYNSEIIKFTNNTFEFGHFLAATEGGLRGFTRANGSVMKWLRTDGFVFSGNLCFGYLYGLNFQTTNNCQLINMTGNLFDQVRFPIYAVGTGNFPGNQITGNSFLSFNGQNTALQGNAITIATSGSFAQETCTISGNTFSICTQDQILVSGNTPIRSLNITGNTFTDWAAFQTSGVYGAVNISGSSTSYTFTGNTVLSQVATYASGVLGSSTDALISSNTFGGCHNAINATFNAVNVTGNVSYNTGDSVSDLFPGSGSVYQSNNLWDKASGTSTRPAWCVRKNASQVFAHSASLVAITFGTATYDGNANWNTSTSTWTCNQSGRYRFAYSILHDNTATTGDRWEFTITPSAGPTASMSYRVPAADYNTVTGFGEFNLVKGGTVQILVTQVGGTGSLTTLNDINSNWLSGSLVE
jgi:hypothetical protein